MVKHVLSAEEAQLYNLAVYKVVEDKIAESGLEPRDREAATSILEHWKSSMVGKPICDAEEGVAGLVAVYKQKSNLHGVIGFAPLEFRTDSIGEIARMAFVVGARIEQAAREGMTDFTPSNGFGDKGKPVGCDGLLAGIAASVSNSLSSINKSGRGSE